MHNSVIDKECIEFLTDPNEARRQKIIEKVTDNIIDRINCIAPPENAVDQIVDHRKNISEINDNESNQFTDKIEYGVDLPPVFVPLVKLEIGAYIF